LACNHADSDPHVANTCFAAHHFGLPSDAISGPTELSLSIQYDIENIVSRTIFEVAISLICEANTYKYANVVGLQSYVTGTVYRYFKVKENLIRQLHEQILLEVAQMVFTDPSLAQMPD